MKAQVQEVNMEIANLAETIIEIDNAYSRAKHRLKRSNVRLRKDAGDNKEKSSNSDKKS